MFHSSPAKQITELRAKASELRAAAFGCSITSRGNENFAALHLEAERCEHQAGKLADGLKTPRQRHADKCRRVMMRVAYAMRGPRRKLGRSALMKAEWAAENQFS